MKTRYLIYSFITFQTVSPKNNVPNKENVLYIYQEGSDFFNRCSESPFDNFV